jgi:site-specific DNA recombinase
VIVAAIYTRISHDPGSDRLGVQRQERECRELAERNGWSVAEVFEDDDVSAYRPGKRPAFARLLTALEHGEVNALVVWHPDRLYRHPKDLERLVDACEHHHIQFAAVTAGSIDLGTASGRMVARMYGAAGRHEVERTVERVRSKHLELALAGKWGGGGPRPYGYERDHKTVREPEAQRIRNATRRVLAGESVHSVARDWTWSTTALSNVLMSARISGRREMFIARNGRRPRVGRIMSDTADWPAIISVEDSDRLRALLGNQKPRQSYARSHLLTGIARCRVCDQLLVAQGSTPDRRRRLGCRHVSVLAEDMERLVEEAVLRRIETGALARALHQVDDELATALQQELLQLQQRQSTLAEEWARGDLDREAWQAARSWLATRRNEVEGQLHGFGHDAALAALAGVQIRKAWASTPLSTKRAAVVAVVEAIYLDRTRVHGRHAFDPDRVTIRWRI